MSVFEDETGWLIEVDWNGGATWWDGLSFTTDSNQAIRFARKDDAEKLIRCMVVRSSGPVWERAIATDHIWYGPKEGV